MAEYIEKEVAKAVIKRRLGKMDLFESLFNADIDAVPAADVAPVVHGRWMIAVCKRRRVAPVADDMICSACKQATERLDGIRFLHCPNCGARMDGE